MSITGQLLLLTAQIDYLLYHFLLDKLLLLIINLQLFFILLTHVIHWLRYNLMYHPTSTILEHYGKSKPFPILEQNILKQTNNICISVVVICISREKWVRIGAYHKTLADRLTARPGTLNHRFLPMAKLCIMFRTEKEDQAKGIFGFLTLTRRKAGLIPKTLVKALILAVMIFHHLSM